MNSQGTILGEAWPETFALIEKDRIRAIYSHGAFAIWFSAVASWMLASHIFLLGAGQVAIYWAVAKTITCVPRLALQILFRFRYRRHFDWLTPARILLFIDGCAWGAAGVYLMPEQNLAVTAVVGATLIGVAAVATFGLHADKVANALYCVPMIVPAAFCLTLRADDFGVYSGISMFVFIAMLLLVAIRAQRRIVELLTLRHMTDCIAAERAEALRLAEQHSQVKSQFLATMSHEMRTPLHGILGLVDMTNPSNLSSNLHLIKSSGKHLLGIINDVLDFSRIEAGHLSLVNQPFSIDLAFSEVCSMFLGTTAQKGIAFQVRGEQGGDPRWGNGDVSRFKQVLINLIGNAVKFTERGSVSVDLTVYETDGFHSLKVQVTDTGIGIDRTEIGRIFVAFHQADNTYGRKFSGTGLGLSIAKEIAKAMHGDITCESIVGHGSTFTFACRFPIEKPPNAGVTSSSHYEQASLSGYVLVAEDNDVNGLVAMAMLQKFGLRVEVVPDGCMAVEKALNREDRPDLVLMDCQMPGMDGFEATKQIRSQEVALGLVRVPIVALTANALNGDRSRCIDAGMDDHLSKPFDTARLSEVLERYTRQDLVRG